MELHGEQGADGEESGRMKLRADGMDGWKELELLANREDRGRARLFSVWVVLREREGGTNGGARQ